MSICWIVCIQNLTITVRLLQPELTWNERNSSIYETDSRWKNPFLGSERDCSYTDTIPEPGVLPHHLLLASWHGLCAWQRRLWAAPREERGTIPNSSKASVNVCWVNQWVMVYWRLWYKQAINFSAVRFCFALFSSYLVSFFLKSLWLFVFSCGLEWSFMYSECFTCKSSLPTSVKSGHYYLPYCRVMETQQTQGLGVTEFAVKLALRMFRLHCTRNNSFLKFC